jgi:hypothetical protein
MRIPDQPFTTADAWAGPDMASRTDWSYRLTREDVAELVAAAAHAGSKPLEAWTCEDFPLNSLMARVQNWMHELDVGRGFVLIKGFPVSLHDETVCSKVYWGLGRHMGRAVSQNTDGDLLGHVRDTGADPNAYGVRLYKTRAEQDFHTDGADIIGLFCLQPARHGGVSRIVSSVRIFNEILARAPELVPVMFEPFPFDTQNQHKDGQRAWFEMPLCRFDGRTLSTFFIPWYIRESQMHAEAPRLSDAQQRVIGLIEEIANDPAFFLDMDFEAGDMQFLKNAVILHKRTAYEDYAEPERKRHLLRLWLVEPNFSGGDERLRKGIAGAASS